MNFCPSTESFGHLLEFSIGEHTVKPKGGVHEYAMVLNIFMTCE